MKALKSILLLALISILLMLLSCSDDDECELFSCSSSDSDFAGDIRARVTINSENPSVEVSLYRGNYDTGELLTTRSTTDDLVSFGEWEAGSSYAATAMYAQGGVQVLAVDGGFLSASKDGCNCPNGAGNLTLNVKLLQ